MSDFIIIDGDEMTFSAMFGVNNVTLTGARKISGTGQASIENKRMCILGDEKKVSIAATYSSSAYPTPGTGTITITSLAADQQVAFATAVKPVIVVGSQFIALFTVESPAQNPNSGPDPVASTPGTGTFINSQAFVRAG